MKMWPAKQTWVSKHANTKADKLNKNKVKKITVIKHAALGDLIHVRPMLITLRKAFPNAQLTLSVVSNYMQGIPEDLIDRLHVAKGNDKKYGIKEIYKSFKELGHQDIIFDISATTRSFWVSKLSSAGLKIGFMHKGLHKMLYDIAIPRAHYRFEAETYLEQVGILGVQYDWPLKYNYPKPERIHKKPYIVYFPTASVAYKCWPPENMAKLINEMCSKYPDIDHVLQAGLADWEIQTADTIANEITNKDNFFSYPPGSDAFSLICHANIVVSSDTGMRHLAIAAATPTVCMFPIFTLTFSYAPRFGNHKAVTANESGSIPVSAVSTAINEISEQVN